MLREAPTPSVVLSSFRQLMHALHAAAGAGRAEPWYACPMTMPQLRAFSLIAASELGLSSRELAATLGVGASAITPLVDRLVERGFVRRDEDPHDRRIARLHATESGSALLERMLGSKDERLAEALAKLSPAQLESVNAALNLLRTAIEESKETPI